ncbi:MAG: hypothetical protein P4L93_11995 [Coriobacteriia bacterium]|nr:hypothetical protein [Coriobacteriia bacterium]
MRARTRFMLDILLTIGLVSAYRPTWTGISLHQWLSIAIIAPLLLHLIVNWQWAIQVLRTFLKRLFSASRLNFVVDCALLVSTVAVMLSGFMVSTWFVGPLGINSAHLLVWHAVHLWSANATIALFALHGALHWRWIVGTAKRLADTSAPARARGAAVVAAASRRTAGSPQVAIAADVGTRRSSQRGVRAKQAAAERAAAMRAASVFAVTAALGLAIFLGVGMVSPLLAHASQSGSVATATLQVCPKTGCTASTCHGTAGVSAAVFYKTKNLAKQATPKHKAATSVAKKASTHKSTVASATRHTTVKPQTVAVAKPKTAVTLKPAARTVTKKRMFTCPQTGCSATSCHGAHGQSASSYYK